MNYRVYWSVAAEVRLQDIFEGVFNELCQFEFVTLVGHSKRKRALLGSTSLGIDWPTEMVENVLLR